MKYKNPSWWLQGLFYRLMFRPSPYWNLVGFNPLCENAKKGTNYFSRPEKHAGDIEIAFKYTKTLKTSSSLLFMVHKQTRQEAFGSSCICKDRRRLKMVPKNPSQTKYSINTLQIYKNVLSSWVSSRVPENVTTSHEQSFYTDRKQWVCDRNDCYAANFYFNSFVPIHSPGWRVRGWRGKEAFFPQDILPAVTRFTVNSHVNAQELCISCLMGDWNCSVAFSGVWRTYN